MEDIKVKKMLFIKYGQFIIFCTAVIVFILLSILHVNNKSLLNMIVMYFIHVSWQV